MMAGLIIVLLFFDVFQKGMAMMVNTLTSSFVFFTGVLVLVTVSDFVLLLSYVQVRNSSFFHRRDLTPDVALFIFATACAAWGMYTLTAYSALLLNGVALQQFKNHISGYLLIGGLIIQLIGCALIGRIHRQVLYQLALLGLIVGGVGGFIMGFLGF
jgi:hypothetical protein